MSLLTLFTAEEVATLGRNLDVNDWVFMGAGQVRTFECNDVKLLDCCSLQADYDNLCLHFKNEPFLSLSILQTGAAFKPSAESSVSMFLLLVTIWQR